MPVINLKNVEKIDGDKCQVHYVPGTINHTENDNISKYFQPKETNETGGEHLYDPVCFIKKIK